MSVWINNGKRMEMSWPIRVRGQQKGEEAKASLRIQDLNGPGREYFSFTHEVTWKGFGRVDLRSCGVLSRDTYLRSGEQRFPAAHVASLAFDLHLCNVHTGEPMHAVANARYFAGLSERVRGKRFTADAEALARHLRITLDDAKMLIMEANAFENIADGVAFLERYIDTLLPEWKRQADELRRVLEVFA